MCTQKVKSQTKKLLTELFIERFKMNKVSAQGTANNLPTDASIRAPRMAIEKCIQYAHMLLVGMVSLSILHAVCCCM